MAKGTKGLATLIRLTKFKVDEKRRELTALQNREEQILAEIAADEQRLLYEQQVASENPAEAGFMYAAYHRAWMQRRKTFFAALEQVRHMIEGIRDELAELFREQKTFELTQANRQKKEQEELNRKEQLFLDEVAQNQHIRKEQSE